MMRARLNENHQCPILEADKLRAKLRRYLLPEQGAALIILVVALLAGAQPAMAQGSFQLLAAPGALTGVLVGSDYVNSFGNINALGIGAPKTGLTLTTLSNGAIYFTPYIVRFANLPNNHRGGLTAFVSTNFAHPTAQILQHCPDTATCTTAGGYSAMSTSAATPSVVVPSPGIANNTQVTAGLGIFLPDNNGAGAFSGVDNTGVITFTMTDLTTNAVVATATFTFNGTPLHTVQNALQFTLATATGGLTVQPTADYSMSFGNVNGLGIGPAAGITTVPASGGVIYSTPYVLQPAFADFASTTGTISVFVSTDFVHPSALQARSSASSAGPYATISKSSATPTTITTTAADRASLTQFLGLFVSNVNGPTAFAGNDQATLTFTLTVP
jgi:hypothetical protein